MNEEKRWLSEWYRKCRNKYIDLVGDFGGSELFVIDGDSLLFKFLYDPETDFLDFGLTISGGQYLALTFLVENFLNKLKERECVFHIAFFDVHKSLWNNRPKLRIAREIIIEHLKSNTKIPVFEFKNWWTEEWKNHLDNMQPLFILTGDGSTENLEIKEKDNYKDKEIDVSSISGIATKKSLKLTIVLRAFIYFSLHMDMPVALLPGMEFKDSRAYAFVLERGGNVNLETQNKLENIIYLTIKALEAYDEKSNWYKNFKLTTSSKYLMTSQEYTLICSNGGKRIAIVLLSLMGVLCNNNDKPYFQYLAKIFLLHVIFLDYLPLKSRVSPPLDSEFDESMIKQFLQSFFVYCAQIYIDRILPNNFQDLNNNLYDLVDTRLFVSLIQFRYDDVLNFNVLPDEIKHQFDACWNLLKRLCECNSLYVDDDDKNFKNTIDKIEIDLQSRLEYNTETTLLPFKYKFFEEYLGDMHLELPENSNVKIDAGQYGLIGNVYYDDITHWHSTKPIETTNKSDFYYNKHKTSLKREGYQKYVRFLERYAASLNGTQGYYPQDIIVEKSGRKSSVKKQSARAIKIIEENEEKKLQESLKLSEKCLDSALKEILKIKNIKKQITLLDDKIEKKGKITHPFTIFRGQFKKLEFLMELWAEHCKTSKVKNDWIIPVEILRQVFYIVQNFPKYLDDKRKKNLIEVLNRLKFTKCKKKLKKIVKVSNETNVNDKKLLSFDFNLPEDSIDLSIEMSDVRFQMLYAGHLMDRNTNSMDDPRVPFKPDEWQVKVLDLIDKDESALICCPTSSGKTFISFYAMEKVLRESDDGILVYVAPTKALVNQVTAEIYGRFKKNYKYGNKTTWGIYTREYRENHEKCQILVTIPQMLEILVLSPQRASWARNIKRIIFDEIHMIGLDGGEYYDHLLLLSRSLPILALSATIGNPEIFHKWMAKSKKAHGPPMKLIKTTKRFSDLQPYVYLPRFPLTSLLETTVNPIEEQRQRESIVPINPIFSLSMIILKEHGLPDDMKLVPSQCIQLWDEMKKHMGNNPPSGFNKLDPDEYFKDIGYIVKDDADKYEQELKKAFTKYARDDSTINIVKSTIEELGTDIKDGFTELELTANGLDVYGDEFFKKGIVPLLCELSAQDKLPAILFHFDRKGCVELALHILEQLELAEDTKRAGDPEYQAKKKEAISQEKARKKELKRTRDLKTKEDIAQSEVPPELETSIPTIFDWEAHDPDFTFVNRKYQVPSEEFEKLIEHARRKMGGNSKLLIALERGIGVHHSGLPKKYLSAVEILFRRRHLRVIIATGSLALGINMPCKTVVFVGDSIFLTALQYRQMSGRSGRRGFDPIGHVIFFGIPLTKIIRLLMSGLPSLSGHFPLTTTLVLRSFNLLNQCKNQNVDDYNYAKNAIKGLFSESFFCLGKEYLSEQIKHHLRFSIEYLMRENLLDQNGNLINLSAMVSHLYYVEPSNFAFSVLFKHGVFHKICSKLRTDSLQVKEKVMDELILILSHLFKRAKLRKISGGECRNPKYPSKVILPPLPKDVNDILKNHNGRILNIYTDYVVTFARNNNSKLGLDNTLPLSLIEIPPKSMDQILLKKDPLISKLESMAISFVARSPFIAVCSSLGDIFMNLEDLTSHIHSEIFLDLHSIPFIKTDENINACISDFFSHGQEIALVESNGIRRGEVWQVLKDFHLILLSIVSSLKTRIEEIGKLDKTLFVKETRVLEGFEMVRTRFEEQFFRIWA
ncbi:P-loop containing nucleoside triphosphate hydrolase protein [Rhizophagus irregularis]|uniref:P-loop containing nucleoside triphosphate hydrolase protein n=1 Tax=Rhizophagus irregularis TaxID=588596 RepID=A0A2I1G3W1_9GLOM|nr:P-loop containing nucleoside triphosphate hydrolase protein [Rhizophagus irregularis]